MLVRALYNYVGEDDEELSFSAGDIITQTEDEDAQGWATGVHSTGRMGIYPSAYVEMVLPQDDPEV